MKRFVVVLFACAACHEPSALRVDISADSTVTQTSPLTLSLYTEHGRVLNAAALPDKLPGDVVLLVDSNDGDTRADARVVVSGVVVTEGIARAQVVSGHEVTTSLVLSGHALADSDGDGVPDEIDDCPSVPDPAQTGMCAAAPDLAMNDLSISIDLSTPPDLSGPGCGNGRIDPGELCDNGKSNSDAPASAATCTTACAPRAPCGTLTGSSGALIEPATGHCYVAWPTVLDFTAAEADCLTRGGHLAAITSAEENARITPLAKVATWIGLIDAAPGNPNVWTTGESSAYAAYAPGEPMRGGKSCVVAQGATWSDEACGWPTTGMLPASVASTAAHVCENSCGNGVVDPGEECDPPGNACTNTCRSIVACTEAGGQTSMASGACYFMGTTMTTYTSALTMGCPAGTHVATPVGPAETDAAVKALSADSWIALRAGKTVGVFVFEAGSATFDSTRYHGFNAPDPDMTTVPACGAISHGSAGRADGWRDRACTSMYPSVCERD